MRVASDGFWIVLKFFGESGNLGEVKGHGLLPISEEPVRGSRGPNTQQWYESALSILLLLLDPWWHDGQAQTESQYLTFFPISFSLWLLSHLTLVCLKKLCKTCWVLFIKVFIKLIALASEKLGLKCCDNLTDKPYKVGVNPTFAAYNWLAMNIEHAFMFILL